jgi:hypothetical protein
VMKIYSEFWLSNNSKVYLWNWDWTTYNEVITLKWIKIDQIINKDWYEYMVWWWDLFVIDWYRRVSLKSIENISSNTNSIAVYNDLLVIWWVWKIYTWWWLNKNYPEVLNKDWKTSNLWSADSIWHIFVYNDELYISWRDWTSFWLDKGSSSYYSQWELITLVYTWWDAYAIKKSIECFVWFNQIQSWDSILIYTRTNLSSTRDLRQTITATSTKRNPFSHRFSLQESFNYIEFKIELNSWNWGTTPELIQINLSIQIDENG